MNIMVRAAMLAASLLLSVLASAPAPGRHGIAIDGRIIAYRPCDRIIQYSSFVINEEVFLFETPPSRGRSRIIKIRYKHVGESEITDRILEQALLMKLELKREASCDETYRQFVSSAPTVRDEAGGRLVSGISFVQKFQGLKPPDDLPLECYVLGEGHLRLIER